MSLSAIPRSLRLAVFERDAGRCRYCRLSQIGQGTIFHINHVVPKSKGGSTVEENLVFQCPHCSLRKSDRTSALDPQGAAQVSLFHPLQQDWAEHFAMLPDGTCVGLTATGRATVEALRMNSLLPRAARAMQLLLGLIQFAEVARFLTAVPHATKRKRLRRPLAAPESLAFGGIAVGL